MTISPKPKTESRFDWLIDLLLIVVVLVGGYFRFKGINWGEFDNQHPDENFITSVTYAIQPLHSLKDYFNTAQSSLSPAAVGYPAYVYGTLPLFIVRYLALWLGQMNHLTLFGRQMSAIADLGTFVLLYFIVKRFYRRRVALLAAAFSAISVMQIQQSHFYTTDNFATFFTMLTLYFAAIIATSEWQATVTDAEMKAGEKPTTGQVSRFFSRLYHNQLIWWSAIFGLALGMAAASKLNAAAVAVTLPVALAVRYFKFHHPKTGRKTDHEGGQDERTPFEDFIGRTIVAICIGAVVSLIAFRVFQPYAFSGPGFFNVSIDANWISKVREQLSMAGPNADLVWALQWAKRTHLFSFENLTIWGLGLPLGILAWAGFIWMAWRMIRGEWLKHILLWSWTAIYFTWQSLQYNATMRYQLPVYPLLAMMAAWIVFYFVEPRLDGLKRINWKAVLAVSAGAVVLILTFCWAFAFSNIYIRTEPRVAATNWIFQNVAAPIDLQLLTPSGETYKQPVPFPADRTVQAGSPYQAVFVAQSDGTLNSINFAHVIDSDHSGTQTLTATLTSTIDPAPGILANLNVTANFTASPDSRGNPVSLPLSSPVLIKHGLTYSLQIETTGGSLTFTGAALANETSFDYTLPFRTTSYDPFGGIYRGDLNLEVYNDDNTDKVTHMQDVLDQTDYILIPTNHQYGQITRIPERYPLTTEYYRQLIGCPAEKNIIWCYRVAEPGMFHGSLGFDLVATFEDYPTIGALVINDQPAEEAFTFYDHPKVLIFKKSADFDPAKLQNFFSSVDYSKAAHLTPGQLDNYKNLLLPADQLSVQQAGGTWTDLFNTAAIYNRYPVLGLLLWYVVIFALGLFVYPLVRAAFPGLPDHGYPLARILGLLLWAWLAWMAGSLGLTYSRLIISVMLGVIVVAGVWLAWRQRKELAQEIRERWKYFLLVEAVFLALFLVDLVIRIGNPDLWHPSKGGERPMDFAYLNAILKSTTFPPYDPWYAGGYINYYYFGYVIVGTPVKLLGIVPSIAYNFILPTLFACLGISAFSVGWNLLAGIRNANAGNEGQGGHPLFGLPFIGGVSASSAMVLLGNLGIIHMLNDGFQRLGTPPDLNVAGNFFQHTWWTIKGFFMVLGGMQLPYVPGDWYWYSSRIFPPGYSDFYEFPLFTFIYSDLHAHMIALMLTVLVISWGLSVLLAKARWKSPIDAVLGFFMGGLIIGSLKPTNTWDFYTYFILGSVVLAYCVIRYGNTDRLRVQLPGWVKRGLLTLAAVGVLAVLSLALFQPFSHWYAQAYNSFGTWTGERTPISIYLTQWGVFLFFIVSWMTWETRQWLAETPISALHKLRPYRDLIIATLVIILLFLIAQQAWVMSSTQNVPWKGVTILWLALPLAVWAAILLFRPGLHDLKRLVLFMIGTGLLLTMVVELIVVSGDIGRFNTVFKFGVQSWILLGLSATAGFGWLLSEFRNWLPGWRTAWQVVATILVAGSALVLIIAGADKMRDRMAVAAPHTLDSMEYMAYSTYSEYGVNMDLSQDYRAIQWMLSNVKGSPVIVEAAPAGVQYAWLGRYSIYTGLTDVIGWEWHQEQQRVLLTADIQNRGRVEVDGFYSTTDVQAALAFLHKYNVSYIILGQLERAKYTPGAPGGPVLVGAADGIAKFDVFNGIYWHAVYQEGQTVIYEVNR
jgi:YYY domain-containing protein